MTDEQRQAWIASIAADIRATMMQREHLEWKLKKIRERETLLRCELEELQTTEPEKQKRHYKPPVLRAI